MLNKYFMKANKFKPKENRVQLSRNSEITINREKGLLQPFADNRNGTILQKRNPNDNE